MGRLEGALIGSCLGLFPAVHVSASRARCVLVLTHEHRPQPSATGPGLTFIGWTGGDQGSVLLLLPLRRAALGQDELQPARLQP